MMLTWSAFFFLAFIAKALLAVAMCYFILPTERTCDTCNGDTLPLRMGWGGRMMTWLMFDTLQKRWCPRCGWEGMTRTRRMEDAGSPVPGIEPAAR